jgi:hypothetical protein
LPFGFAAYTLAFYHYIVTYFAYIAITLSTGLAGLTVWKQKYLLLAAPNGGQFYEFMLPKCQALG